MTHRRPFPPLCSLAYVSLFTASAASARAGDPVFPGADWERATPESQGMDPALLAEAVEYLRQSAGRDGVDELVIVRNGRLVWEGPRAGEAHGVWSVTKSFTSTVLGLLVDDGKCALDSRAAGFVPALARDYGEMTLRHLTTMTSGYRAAGDEPRGSYTHGPSPTPFAPSPEPLFSPPGSRYAYWDSAMNLLGLVLTRVAGEPLEEVFRRRLADPIGMKGWEWGDFGAVSDGLSGRGGPAAGPPAGGGPAVNGGSGNGGKHVTISAREIARLGLLFLHRGVWSGRRLLSAEWVDAATTTQVPSTLPWGHAASGIDGRGVYGWNWWTNGVNAQGTRRWPGAPADTFAASGFNNNELFVVRSWNLVVARLGLDEDDRKTTDEAHGEFLRRLGETIRRGRPGPDPLEAWRLASQRAEIAPFAWVDEAVSFDGQPALALAGNGHAATDGRWARSYPVTAGAHLQFETFYRARDVDEPLRSLLARILWVDGDGRQIGRAEHPPTARGEDPSGWRAIRDLYRAPEGATSADVELILRWDADGVAHFGGTRLEATAPPGPRPVRLASIHHRPRGGKTPRDNLEQFAPLVARAAEKRAGIVCLPEGVTVCGTGKSYVDVAEPVPGPSTAFLGELARRHGVHIVAGTYERDGPAVYNTAVLLDAAGELLGKYRKVCLPREEIEGGITPGVSLPVFDTKFGRVGIMICWDVFFPEPARELARQGAEVIFLPIWGGDLTLARARAIENQVYLVSSTYDMKTAVFDRRGEVLAEASDNEPVIVVEVDLAERTLWPWLGDFGRRIPREMPAREALGKGAE
jgi:predicted amidohydrolase/CubicO group peptidase (beta-lactamase class C family)